MNKARSLLFKGQEGCAWGSEVETVEKDQLMPGGVACGSQDKDCQPLSWEGWLRMASQNRGV